MKAADRRWELKTWKAEWVEIIAADATTLVLASGQGIWWRSCVPENCGVPCSACMDSRTWRPREGLELRYTCPVKDPEGSLVWMEHRPGGMVLLLQDMEHVGEAESVRQALGGQMP